MNVIKIKNLSFGYIGKIDILNDINLEIEKEKFICIVGANGSRQIYSYKMYSWIKQRI